MLLDRRHTPWFRLTLLLLAVATICYVPYHISAVNGPSGGSLPGLLYGIIGTLMLLFAALYGARRSLGAWRLGSAQFWLRGHLWLGSASVVFVLFHTGLRLQGPAGKLDYWLLWTYLLVIATGVFGQVVQMILPRQLTTHAPRETFVQQLPFLCQRLQVACDRTVALACRTKLETDPAPLLDAALSYARNVTRIGNTREAQLKDLAAFLGEIYTTVPLDVSVKKRASPAEGATESPPEGSASLMAFYTREVRPFLEYGSRGRSALRRETDARSRFHMARKDASPALASAWRQLADACAERREYLQIVRLHRLMYGWLYLHVPATVVTLVLLVFHIVMTFRVVPF